MKKNWNFFRGYPPFGPPEPVSNQKWPPMPSYDPPILMHNPFLHKKWGCLQKTKSLYFEKWPSYGHVKFGKRNLKISKKLAWPTKILITPSIFEIWPKWPKFPISFILIQYDYLLNKTIKRKKIRRYLKNWRSYQNFCRPSQFFGNF